MPDSFPLWFIPCVCAVFGACIGSFLNVVIYRIPREIPVNNPPRSFCPGCKTPIPLSLNIPIFSWLLLRGKCRSCGIKIPVRYWLVEVVTALLFGAMALANPEQPALSIAFMCLWAAAAIAIAWIDAEHMLVFPSMTIIGVIFGLGRELFGTTLAELDSYTWDEAILTSLIGAVSGYLLIRAVILFGRILFGKWEQNYPSPVSWEIVEPEEEMAELLLRFPDKDYEWGDIFSHPKNTAMLYEATVIIDGKTRETGNWKLMPDRLITPSGESIHLADIHSAGGTVSRVQGNREAMGSGDAWIMMMIGSICGWQGVLFSLLAGSIFGIITGIACRKGFGAPLPFGPSLIAAAIIWLLGGHSLWGIYMNWVMP